MGKNRQKKSVFKYIAAAVAGAVLIMIVAMLVYIGDYYHALPEAESAMESSKTTGVNVYELAHKELVFEPENPVAGLIFYPGGKVEYTAYAPLMKSFAEQNILCVLVHMPGNLAVFDSDAAEGIASYFPKIDNWYMAGHSLGGAMAATYVSSHIEEYKGLILLAAYSTEDLSDTGLQVLSVYGSEDQVLSLDAYNDNLEHFPNDYEEYVIAGGCHGYFGMYGMQEGDGVPTILPNEQQQITADVLQQWIAANM